MSWIVWLSSTLLVALSIAAVFQRVRAPRPSPATPTVPVARPGLITDRQIRHLDVVDQFTGFVTQHVITAATLASRSSGRPLADIAAELCRVLFGDPTDVDHTAVMRVLDSVDDRDTRATTLRTRATDIRRQAATLGGNQQWDFTHTQGQPYDERRHTPWLDNHPGGPVTAVITPAYVVDHHILCRQRVTTGAH